LELLVLELLTEVFELLLMLELLVDELTVEEELTVELVEFLR